MAKKVIKITQDRLNEMVSRIVSKVISESKLGDYVTDVHDNIVAGYNMGNGEPKDWKEAVTRCGYDLIDSNELGFTCQRRYGFMGSQKYMDEPEDVAQMLKRFGMNVQYMGEFRTLNGNNVEKFKFV